ncbi:MAG: flagellar biosynthesis protein FlgA [Deltaproteobacteria bacterium]|nr:MAG: flagellar biosynthesis protein FlgA [Deltaproteobacteria bacterium]
MNYDNLFAKAGKTKIRAGLIGIGTYGISLMTQARFIPRLEIPVVCDQDPKTARLACLRAGLSKENTTVCSNIQEILLAMEKGQYAIAENYELLMDVPLDVVVECTGNPEAGARHAELAIKHGKHVAMVNKEADAVVGPMLSRLADKAGVTYTPVDGDQHGLLIGLVSWAGSLGLEVVCSGKARPYDFVYDENTGKVTNGLDIVSLSREEKKALLKIQPGESGIVIEKRRKFLLELPQIAEADLCESVIVANATGLIPDLPSMHAPIVRITEIADVLSRKEDGGILKNRGVIDLVTCLRRKDEAGLGGGVFLVFSFRKDDAWELVKDKGLLTNHRGTCGVVYRPYHLLGVETPISILCAGLLNLSTGSLSYKPRADLIGKAKKDLKAGSSLQFDREKSGDLFEHLIVPFAPIDKDSPIPFYMALGNQLKANVPAGSILTWGMIKEPENSRLWELRRQQDQAFEIK